MSEDTYWKDRFAARTNELLELHKQHAALLEVLAPMLDAAEKATPGPWEMDETAIFSAAVDEYGDNLIVLDCDWSSDPHAQELLVIARNTAAALRDLLGGAL